MSSIAEPNEPHSFPGCEGDVQCPLCGSTSTGVVYRQCRNRQQHIAEKFDVLRCLACDAGFLHPRPKLEILSKLYGRGYHSHLPAPRPLGRAARWLRMVLVWPYRIRFGREMWSVTPFGGRRLLDIGCGTGDFLETMHSLGWRCYGADVSKDALEATRQRNCTEALYCGGIESLPFERDTFEVITLWHALEHMPDPADVLARICELLVPGGRLVLVVPNLDSAEARLLGRRWIEIDVPGHLYFFTPRCLKRLIERAGLRWSSMRPQFHPSSVSDAIDFLIDDLAGTDHHKQRLQLYRLFFPLVSLSYTFGNHGCIEVVAAKP